MKMVDGQQLRAPWRQFSGFLGADAAAGLNRHQDDARRQIRDNGVSYNVYADASGPSRPVATGVLPMLIGADEWAQIEAGVAQRGAAECHGAGYLRRAKPVAAGLLPPALVAGHPGYLRALSGFCPPAGIFKPYRRL